MHYLGISRPLHNLGWLSLGAALVLSTSNAGAQMSEARQQQALDTIKQYVMDMSSVLPCFYIGSPPEMWDKNYGEPELSRVLKEYMMSGASSEQAASLRKVYNNYLSVKWVDDIRSVARACNDKKLFISLSAMSGPATPLLLRPPFRAP